MSSREIYDGMDGIVERKSYGFRDPIVKNVVDKFIERSNTGYSKYGSTLDDERKFKMKNLQGYLNDIQEAYNVISKRTGKMINGTFVKDN